MIDITQTSAYQNTFFDKSENHLGLADVVFFIREWFPVTQAFCLASLGYMSVFAREIISSEENRRDMLEKAILVPIAIGTGEFEKGKGDVGGIHYRMFARLGEPVGLTIKELRHHPRGALIETGRLVDGIRETMGDLYLGAGCIRVVEATAYNIVEAMDRLFRPMRRQDGSPMYSERDLEYISLHLQREKGHNLMAESFAEALCETWEHRASMYAGIERMCGLFGDYWEALARVVFLDKEQMRSN
jgi:hypothetical protein